MTKIYSSFPVTLTPSTFLQPDPSVLSCLPTCFHCPSSSPGHSLELPSHAMLLRSQFPLMQVSKQLLWLLLLLLSRQGCHCLRLQELQVCLLSSSQHSQPLCISCTLVGCLLSPTFWSVSKEPPTLLPLELSLPVSPPSFTFSFKVFYLPI